MTAMGKGESNAAAAPHMGQASSPRCRYLRSLHIERAPVRPRKPRANRTPAAAQQGRAQLASCAHAAKCKPGAPSVSLAAWSHETNLSHLASPIRQFTRRLFRISGKTARRVFFACIFYFTYSENVSLITFAIAVASA